MADNITAPGEGTILAADDVSGVIYPRAKVCFGADGSATDVSTGSPLPISDAGGSITVDGTVGVSGSVAVTGTFWQATQPVSIASAVPVTDNSGSITVDAPVATPVFVRLSDGSSAISTLPVSLASLPALVAGSAIVGKVGIDQTTDGTTNKVNIDASLKSGTATRSSVNSSTTSATILAANTSRKGAVICNSDANALLLDLSGSTASSTRYQKRLVQYESYELPAGYTGLITGIWEADGSGVADVVEFT